MNRYGRCLWTVAVLSLAVGWGQAPVRAQYDDFDMWYEEFQLENAWQSWWNMEWANALGDDYPAPEYMDDAGNFYYEDAYGYLHDYDTGMSDVEWGSVESSIYGIQKAHPVGPQGRVRSLYQAASDARWLQDASALLAPRLKAPDATWRELYVGAFLEAGRAAQGRGSFQQALRYLEQAAQRADRDRAVAIEKARIVFQAYQAYKSRSSLDTVLGQLNRLRQAHPDRADLHRLAAELYALTGQKEKARDAFEQARQAAPQAIHGLRLDRLGARPKSRPQGIQGPKPGRPETQRPRSKDR
ncbi:hypothetical protein HRbin11_00912 [bacterium HR11]|nr:hypothetical protein HRbin11_00912 [bacterium HR11]